MAVDDTEGLSPAPVKESEAGGERRCAVVRAIFRLG